MARSNLLPWFSALVLTGAACGSAYADRMAVPEKQVMVAPLLKTSPYKVDLIDSAGRSLNVYQHRGRFYILGTAGDRYSVRITNPTARRVEAVISIDGLDAIDGQQADYVRKRGYVVPPHGTLKVDGFRISTSQVATFRFSSVSESYAGRKGVARNVGVIGVALFEEKAAPQIIHRAPPPRPYGGRYRGGRGGDFKDKGYDQPVDDSDRVELEEAPAVKQPVTGPGTSVSGGAPAPRHRPVKRDYSKTRVDRRHCCNNKPAETRPGLGTKYGESRYSSVTWTRFVRANLTVPTAMAELRYNNSQGLAALGIRLLPGVSPDEIHKRETADPFPRSRGFASPPASW